MNRTIRRKLLAQVPVVAADTRRGPDALEQYRRTGDAKLWPAAVRIVGERLAKLSTSLTARGCSDDSQMDLFICCMAARKRIQQ